MGQKIQLERKEKELEKKRRELQERGIKIREMEEKFKNQPPMEEFRNQVKEDYLALKTEFDQAKSLHFCLNDFRQVLQKQHKMVQNNEDKLKFQKQEFEEEKKETAVFYRNLTEVIQG